MTYCNARKTESLADLWWFGWEIRVRRRTQKDDVLNVDWLKHMLSVAPRASHAARLSIDMRQARNVFHETRSVKGSDTPKTITTITPPQREMPYEIHKRCQRVLARFAYHLVDEMHVLRGFCVVCVCVCVHIPPNVSNLRASLTLYTISCAVSPLQLTLVPNRWSPHEVVTDQ